MVKPMKYQLLTSDEVAEMLHVSRPTVYNLARSGVLPGVVQVGARLRFEPDVLLAWIRRNREPLGGLNENP